MYMLETYFAMVTSEFNSKLQTIRSGNSGEYILQRKPHT